MDEGPWDAVDRAAGANELHRPVRIDDGVVTRPAGEHTATVHAYLRHLRAQGLECGPEPLGVVDGIEPQQSWVAEGAAERDLEEIRWIEEHRADL